MFLILGYALMAVKPNFETYYRERAKKGSTKIGDAVQLKAQWNDFILPNSLVILPSIDRILTHYVSGDVTKANVTTLLDGKVNEIILIGPKPFKTENFLISQSEKIKNKIPLTAFEPVREIGDLIVSRFLGDISRVFPKYMEPDFEGKLVKPVNLTLIHI